MSNYGKCYECNFQDISPTRSMLRTIIILIISSSYSFQNIHFFQFHNSIKSILADFLLTFFTMKWKIFILQSLLVEICLLVVRCIVMWLEVTQSVITFHVMIQLITYSCVLVGHRAFEGSTVIYVCIYHVFEAASCSFCASVIIVMHLVDFKFALVTHSVLTFVFHFKCVFAHKHRIKLIDDCVIFFI